MSKLISSMSTIPYTHLGQTRSRSVLSFQQPSLYSNPYPLKFPKNLLRKRTSVNMLTESSHNPEKLCIRAFAQANVSHIDDTPIQKRIAKATQFNHLAYQSPEKNVANRSFEDIGLKNNLKRQFAPRMSVADPIIHYTQPVSKKNPSKRDVIKDQGIRNRDHGVNLSESLHWTSYKKKQTLSGVSNSYSVIHLGQKAAKQLSTHSRLGFN